MGLVSDLVAVGVNQQQARFLGVESQGFQALLGNSQATGFPITGSIIFNSGTAVTAIAATLPKAEQAPNDFFIRNDSGLTMSLYPASGEYINLLTVNTAIPIGTGRGAHCIKIFSDRFIVLVSAA